MADRMKIDKGPVLVTGATGYVAGWIVKRLLDEGVTVHAAVRNPDSEEKVAHLKKLTGEGKGELRFFKADLLNPGSYAEAMQGCKVVFHTASPFTLSIKDPQKELIDPAVEGTKNVLNEANCVASVERVVLTSSCAAIYSDAVDTHRAPGGRVTEDVWNTTASLDYQPYCLSKTLAEKAAWDMANAQSRWKLVVMNPAFVVGPSLQAHATSESFEVVRQMGDGTAKQGMPRIGIAALDVRDLAEAHLRGAYIPEAEGRHILFAESTDMCALAMMLLPKFGKDWPLPRKAAPKPLIWLVSPCLMKLPRKFVSNNVNVEWRGDNSKGKTALGVQYRPLTVSMEEMFEQMIASGQFEKKKK